jgi:hypothetical protein
VHAGIEAGDEMTQPNQAAPFVEPEIEELELRAASAIVDLGIRGFVIFVGLVYIYSLLS